jgi:hypothetical protein
MLRQGSRHRLAAIPSDGAQVRRDTGRNKTLTDTLRHRIQRAVVLSSLPALLVTGWLATQEDPDYRNRQFNHHTISADRDDLGHNPILSWDDLGHNPVSHGDVS